MKPVVIDYSPFYYSTIVKKAVPAKRAGKFIQIRDGEKEYVVFSPKDLSQYHANIAERFFEDQGVPGTYNQKGDHFAVSSTEWEIIGGGVWTINDKEKSLRLSGSSLAYGKYDRRGLQERLASAPELTGYSIVIE